MAPKRNFMQLDCTDEMLALIKMLDDINCRAMSIWMRAIVQLRMNGMSMNLRRFLMENLSNHMTKNCMIQILSESGYFVIDKEANRLSFSEYGCQFFSVRTKADKCRVEKSSCENSRTMEGLSCENSRTMEGLSCENSRTMNPPNTCAVDKSTSEENKENRENKDKKNVEKKDTVSMLLTAATTPEEKEFYESMLRCYPRICQMKKPLEYAQYQRLLELFDAKKLGDVLRAMENRPDLHRRYLSAYLTARTWLKNE